MDAAAALVAPLLDPDASEHVERKKAQLQQLAVLNGTVRPEVRTSGDQLGEFLEREAHGSKAEGAYRLPLSAQKAADQQYQRDVRRLHGTAGMRLSSAEMFFTCCVLHEHVVRVTHVLQVQTYTASMHCKLTSCSA